MTSRSEKDSMGAIDVPQDKLWGAQTQRSLEHFRISTEKMPVSLIQALALTKRAAAKVNQDLGLLAAEKATAIINAADEVLAGKHPDEFPLAIWQTGSGTQSNMNMNEVLANRGSELLGGVRGMERKIHPNDDVNKSQSSNDVFPTAMHVAALIALREQLIPQLNMLKQTLNDKAQAFADIVKIGRTHLQDATPLTLGQEISGWVAMLEHNLRHIDHSLPHLAELALGGTAVGTGLNTHPEYAVRVAEELATITGQPFVTAPNKFEALATCDALVHAHGALKGLAASLMKIANDVRWLASGPRCGIGEISIPENEPGSSIMPGKVNPVIPEVVSQVAYEVIGNDVAISMAAEAGEPQLNAFEPVIFHKLDAGTNHLTAACYTLADRCVSGITANEARLKDMVEHSIGLATALNPILGYSVATGIAAEALVSGRGVAEIVNERGLMTPEQLAEVLSPTRLANLRPLPGDPTATGSGAETPPHPM